MEIRRLRKQLGLSQGQLAKLVGVQQGTISMWESNTSPPTHKNLVRLTKILNCTFDELIGSEEYPSTLGGKMKWT